MLMTQHLFPRFNYIFRNKGIFSTITSQCLVENELSLNSKGKIYKRWFWTIPHVRLELW